MIQTPQRLQHLGRKQATPELGAKGFLPVRRPCIGTAETAEAQSCVRLLTLPAYGFPLTASRLRGRTADATLPVDRQVAVIHFQTQGTEGGGIQVAAVGTPDAVIAAEPASVRLL